MTPKWICYTAANFGLVMSALLMRLLYPRLPWLLLALVFIVSLIGINLILWYSLRLRARAALATDQTSANHKPRRTLQFMLIGSGLLLLVVTVFGSFDQFTRIVNVVCALLCIAYGTVFRRRRRGS